MDGRPGLPGVPARGSPVASSTPRPIERPSSGGPLLASAPDGVAPANRDGTSLRTIAANRGPRWTRLPRRLPGPGRVCPDAPRVRPPLKTIVRVASRA